MLGKIKKVLGIEGVRVQLICDDSFEEDKHVVDGLLRFTTKSDGKVKSFTIKLVEQYTRGRKKSKLTDEYTLGVYHSDEGFAIKKEEIIEVPFTLEYQRLLSEMDKLQKGSFFTAGIISLAKKIKGVKSTFKLIVEADVSGTKLNPFDSVSITLR